MARQDIRWVLALTGPRVRVSNGSYERRTGLDEEVMARAGASRIDILKLDIEGAEQELFESDSDTWLDRVNALIVELHDRLRPGCSDAFYRAIRRHNFARLYRGEHVLLVRQGRLA